MNDLELIEKALEARKKAYAPYSKHRVGAVVVTKEGKIFSGCNVENCALPVGDCAEKVTLYKAVSEGYKQFKKIVIATGNEHLSPPCGSCRQVIREFCKDVEILVATPRKKYKVFRLTELLPYSFGPEELLKGQD